ncbi:MAG: DUF1684 domain-containing protein [Candidatus Eisenbacteria bacterium]
MHSKPRTIAFPARVSALVLALAAVLAGCARKADDGGPVAAARPEEAPATTVTMWRSQFDAHRAQWEALMTQSDSPLPEEKRATFEGLRFFPFEPSWRYAGDLERLRPPRFVELPDTKGKGQAYLEYGRFPFERDGVVTTLVVHRPVEHPDQFFIAFTDSTSGGETYGGGRYVHLDSLDTHRFVLDFNKAYNPYCAWDASWICPLPPRENALPFAVRAGMMAPESQ